MSSLPNLHRLTCDPSETYEFEFCVHDDIPETAENLFKPGQGIRLPTFNSNSQNEVNKYKTNLEQNIQIQPFVLGKNVENLAVQMYHHNKVRQTKSSGEQCNYYIHGGGAGVTWEGNVPQKQMSSNYTPGPNNVMFNPGQVAGHRKDSLTRYKSFGGASSVRRLIAVVRSTPSRFGPIYSRRVLCRNFAALCLGHATITAALFPLLALQSSVSAWWWPSNPFEDPSDFGSLLLCGAFAIASLMTLVSPFIIHLLGCNWTLVTGYLFVCGFFVAHLYPTVRSLIPAYLLLGVSLGPIACARVSYLITLANKLTYVMTEEEEEYEQLTGDGKDNIMQKLLRGLQASQDLGMVVGSAVAWFFLSYTQGEAPDKHALAHFFQEDDRSERVCGSQSCPIIGPSVRHTIFNNTWNDINVVPCRTTALLASVFVGCGVVAVGLTAAFTDKIRLFIYQDPRERPALVAAFHGMKSAFKDPRLQLAAPMSIFIGLQQGFIFSDFSKWYVVCSLNVSNVSLVFLSMGLLQSVAAFTLSLLMQIVPRYLVIVTGFIFHSCLLLVLLMWQPSGDDSALFYVIAAAWGVCNVIWETLNFTLLMHIYPDSTWHSAFVHGNFFKLFGLAIGFGLHGSVCTQFKLYSLTASMLLGIIPHIYLEMKLEAMRKSKSGVTPL